MSRGHSEIVVDGYNLLYKLFPPSLSESLDVLRQETEKLLLSFQRNKQCPITIVYDGKGASGECAYGAPLHIVYTPASKSADLWIIDYVKSLNTKVKMVTIVSSDDEIRLYATAFGAKCIKSEEFVRQLKKNSRAEPQNDRHIPSGQLSFKEKEFNEKLLSDQEVDRWMKLFTRNKS
ncbi:MAG: NYN domain-containing protein [Chlorobiaceae bacterium]